MQPINAGTIQKPITTPLHKASTDQRQKPVKTDSPKERTGTTPLPEDVVNLSSESISQSSKNSTPSIPVSNEEKNALLKPAAKKINFSTYA